MRPRVFRDHLQLNPEGQSNRYDVRRTLWRTGLDRVSPATRLSQWLASPLQRLLPTAVVHSEGVAFEAHYAAALFSTTGLTPRRRYHMSALYGRPFTQWTRNYSMTQRW